jgi:predicted transcriptional regulator
MKLPTQRQAHAFWMHAIGMTYAQIAEELNTSPANVCQMLQHAKARAREVGLTYNINKPAPEPTPKVGSGMLKLIELAREAGLVKEVANAK